MLTFDKMLVWCDCSAIRTMSANEFSVNKQKNIWYYKHPTLKLEIKIDYPTNYLTIEFTSTILGDRMNELINADNIRRCFENINSHSPIVIDIDYIMEHAVVCKADVTIDKRATDDFFSEFVAFTKLNIRNNNCYIVERYKRHGVVIRKLSGANDARYKHRMLVYNKQKEYERQYRHMTSYVPDLFKGYYRIERNLFCQRQIRKALSITDCSLSNVLNARTNPLLALYEKMVDTERKPVCVYGERKRKEIQRRVERNDWDICKIEAELRSDFKYYSTRMLLPYKQFIAENSDTRDRTFAPAIKEFLSIPIESARLF